MKRNPESGQALVFTAVAIFVLIGVTGLAIDMGVLRYQKRLQQSAADAAAIAGANNLSFPASGGVTAGAQNGAAGNGFTDNSGGTTCTNNPGTVGCVTVAVNNPPLSGPHVSGTTNADKYVEVLVTVVQPTYFMQAVGIPSETITARAVATNLSGGANGGGCLWTLGPPSSAIEGVAITGHATLNATTCGIADNGNYNPTGGALTINAGTFGVAGDCSGSGCKDAVTCSVTPDSCPTFGTPASGDPFASLTPPCSPCSGGTALSSNGTTTFSPGTYTSISLAGNGTVTFNPGVYIIDTNSGFTCNGTPNITGTGVMFYFTNGATWNCTGNDTITLTAPSATNCTACAAQYDGILMYQDPNYPSGPSLGGNTGSSYDGVLYFPKSEVTFFGNSTSVDVAMVVADAFALSGNPTVTLQGAAGLPTGVSILTNAVLVE